MNNDTSTKVLTIDAVTWGIETVIKKAVEQNQFNTKFKNLMSKAYFSAQLLGANHRTTAGGIIENVLYHPFDLPAPCKASARALAMHRFGKDLNEAFKKFGIDITLRISPEKKRGPMREVWFEGTHKAPTPTYETMRQNLDRDGYDGWERMAMSENIFDEKCKYLKRHEQRLALLDQEEHVQVIDRARPEFAKTCSHAFSLFQ